MGKQNMKTDGQAGFTLVELAVVMIIIGLLIGGILKGQELIANAQITGTAAAVKGIDAATTTFRDTFAAMPGDITNPDERLPNCAAGSNCAAPGNGNSRVEATGGGSITAGSSNEMDTFWLHLAAADLITGIDPSLGNAFGGNYPSAPIGGGFFAGYDNTAGGLGANAGSRAGHYLILNDNPGGAPAGTALSALQAARLDRKLDDGVPDTGTVFSGNAGDTCLVASAGGLGNVYNEPNGNATCDLYIRFQN